MIQQILVVDGITERYRMCAVNAAKTNDGLFCILAFLHSRAREKNLQSEGGGL